MPPLALPSAVTVAAAGLLIAIAGVLAVRRSGAHLAMGRRLAGARTVRIGDLDPGLGDALVRVPGRVRCADPIVTPDGDRLAVLHRTIEVRLPRVGWRAVERVREARVFELWDHSGQLTLDPSLCAEPLVAIPSIWRGHPNDLPADQQPAVRALATRHGIQPEAARAETRSVSVIDNLLVLARPVRSHDGRVTLAPPPGGYVISTLPADAAMRLLGGERRGLLVGGAIAVGLGALAMALGAAIAVVVLIA